MNLIFLAILMAVMAGIISLATNKAHSKKARGKRAGEALIPDDWTPPASDPVYEGKAYMMSKAEAQFYRALKVAAGNDFEIMCQVSLYQVIQPRPMPPQHYQAAINRINRKTLDFVLCDPRTMKTIAAIELDDRTHNRNDRIYRDTFLNKAMEEAGVPLIRFQAKATYAAAQIARELEPFKRKTAA